MIVTLKGCYVAVLKILVFSDFGVHHEFLNEDTHIITGKHAGLVTVGPICFIRIFTRVASRLKGASKNSAAVNNGSFQYCHSLVL